MLTLTRIRSEIDAIKLALSKRNLSDEQMASLDTLIELDDKRKSTQTDMDEQLSQINKISKEIGEHKIKNVISYETEFHIPFPDDCAIQYVVDVYRSIRFSL